MKAPRIAKKYAHLVEGIDIDSEITEVVLKDGFINPYYGETIWVYAHEHLEYGATLADRQNDLNHWLSNVEPIEAA